MPASAVSSKLKELLGFYGKEVQKAHEAMLQVTLLKQYNASGVIPKGMTHEQEITIKDPSRRFTKARAIKLEAAMEKLRLLTVHWEEVALRLEGLTLKVRND